MPLYTPLLEGSVRLLRILPHPDKHSSIKCHLFTCTLLDSGSTHPYEALSYVWGSEKNQQSISINNCELSVRANLHAALSHLRDRFIERIIWIDAICINQEDNDEKGQQVQSMAKIYAKASRVIVWLGEAAGNSDQVLEAIRKAAEEQDMNSAIDKTNQQSILALLERPWFQRIWVLQEVAAARHILIKCGPMEIDGYAFCSGLSALKISYETCPDLQGLIHPVVYLIRGAVFRPRHERYETSRPGRFSLGIRPLGELVDMYHTREATDRRDKVYALLGLSLDDPSAAGLSANYNSPWKEVFQKFVKFSLSDKISVGTWDGKEVAIVEGKARVLGEISSVKPDITQDDRQSVEITWKNAPNPFGIKGNKSSRFTFQALAKPIQVGDAVCLLQGASKPTIFRLCNNHSAVITITAPLTNGFKWPEPSQSITTFPNDLLLVWDWNVSRGKSQDGEDYEYLMSSRRVPEYSRTELQDDLDKAIRLWNFGVLLHEMERYEEAGKNFQKAMEVYETVLRSMDNTKKADVQAMADLLIEDRGGYVPLPFAARIGHKAIVKQLLATGRVDPDSKDTEGGTPLSHAARSGQEAIVRLLLEKGANVDVKDADKQTPLTYAAWSGHEAIVWLLLEKGANVEAKDGSCQTPLSLAAESGHEAVMRLLLEKGANVEAKDGSYRTPLSYAAKSGHEAVVQLLLEKGANIEVKDGSWQTPLLHAARSGHEAIVRLLLEKGANIEAKDGYYRTSLSYAIRSGHEAIVRLLLEKGANIEAKDGSWQTPLLHAARSGHEAIVRLLLEKGANIEAKDVYYRTSLSYAIRSGHEAVVQLLREKGAC